MAPLNASYFGAPLADPSFDLHLHNAWHGQTKGKQMYPMCFTGMTAAAWRFALAPFGGPSATPESIIDAIDAELDTKDSYLDQHTLYRMCADSVGAPAHRAHTASSSAPPCRLARWTNFFGTERLLRTPFHDKRIDRKPDVRTARARLGIGAVDLHMLRPPYSQENWGFFRNELIPRFVAESRITTVQTEMDDFIRDFAPSFIVRKGPKVYVPPR